MPKKPVKDVQGIRFELQQSERDALEAYMAGSTITGLLNGIGNALMPFSGAITALAAAWIAGEIADEAKEFLDGIVNKNRDAMASPANDSYSAIVAYLYPLSWPIDKEDAGRFKKSPNGKKTTIPQKWMRKRFQDFINQTQQTMFISQMETQNLTPAEAWSLFFPISEMENEAIYNVNRAASTLPFIGWLVPDPGN